MNQIQPVLTGGDETNLGTGFTPDPFVHLIGVAEGLSREPFMIDNAVFLTKAVIVKADVQTIGGQIDVRCLQRNPVRVAIHNGRDLNRILHRLEANP